MTLIQVTVSGTVGKQVIPANRDTVLRSIILSPSGANSTIKIRDGAAPVSADIVFFGRALSAQGAQQFKVNNMRFDKGLHVTVIGTNAQAYLDIS